MNRKQNSLMRFSRTERLAQLSEQEIVIERKKKEILAKIEAQKKKDTEEALKKLESSKETKSNRFGFSKKSWMGSEYKKNIIKETLVEPAKESLTNAFSNDGSFLDQFKKLSKSGSSSDNVDHQTVAATKKSEEFKKYQDTNEKNSKNLLTERKEDYRNVEKNIGGNHTLKCDDNHSLLDKEPLNSEVQLSSSALAKMPPQQQGVLKKLSDNNPTSLPSSHSIQTSLDQVSKFNTDNSQLSSSHSNYSGTVKPVPHIQFPGRKSSLPFESKRKDDSVNFKLGCDSEPTTSLTSIQPPLPIPPQNIPPPSPIQVQNIPPPPPISSKDNELPKYRTEGILLSLKANKPKKLEMIPNPLEIDEPSSPKKSSFSFSEKNEILIPSQNITSATGSENVSSHKECSVSSAFYDDNEDEDVDHVNEKWAQLVARCGDEFEDSLRNRHQNEQSLRFLFEKNSKEYLSYRKLVLKYRRQNSEGEISPKTEKKSYEEESEEKMLFSKDEKKLPEISTSKSDGIDLKNPKSSEASDLHEPNEAHNKQSSYNEIPEMTSKEHSSLSSQEPLSPRGISNNYFKENNKEIPDQTKPEERRKRKRKSRWGDVATTSTFVGLNEQLIGKLPQPKSTLLSQLTRSDPGLIQYARQTFGSTNLSEEDWKKAEDHYKINLLYQDMVKKRAEVEKLEKQGKFKYEYDSDEDTEGGTWEHKLRQQEMQATQLWAEELTRQAAGKHHIGDFLPPDELERFMEKYNAVKEGREPDLSDYKEYKLKEDNVGYRLLQKMGWNEGQGLGQDGSGIQNPVNKATTRHENQGLGVERPDGLEAGDDEYDAYRKRMMLAYRFRPNPLNNPRRPYY